MAASSVAKEYYFTLEVRSEKLTLYNAVHGLAPTTGETLEVVCVSQVTTFSSTDSTTLFRLACLGFDSMINNYTINQ